MRKRIKGGESKEAAAKDCGGTEKPEILKSADAEIKNHRGKKMKIAVDYENGEVFQHFGHTAQFKLYDREENKIAGSEIVDTMGSGHGALAGFLAENGVDTLICGGIGGGAQTALAEAGIKLYGGVRGNADQAVKALLGGELVFDPEVRCSHHEHEHGAEGHSCGSHGCGSHESSGHSNGCTGGCKQ